MRCHNCLRMTISALRNCEVLQQSSFTALKKSAESGCDLCNLSYSAIVANYSHATTKIGDNEVKIIDILCRDQNPVRADKHDTRIYLEGQINDYYECDKFREKTDQIIVRVGDFSAGENSIHAFLKVGVNSESPITKYIAGRVPSQDPGDPVSMSKIRHWIATCDQEHQACTFLSAGRTQPTRILDISKDNPVVLHTNSAQGTYLALSYCWGTSGKNVLLTSSTFDQFTSTGVDRSILPQTIQDAIIVCRTLSVQYLWIDALCIIQRQPNLEDFIAEAPKMSDYYRNAYLTLIAGSAQDCADGFLLERNNLNPQPCEIMYDRVDFPSDKSMTGSAKLFLLPSQEPGPIQSRAWTFQESALSPRSLVFGLDQMRFVCPTCSIYEDGEFQKIYKPDERLSFNPAGYPNIHHLVKYSNKAEVVSRAYETWFGVLHGYTSRNLSNPQDKLAAIAGYANLLQSIVQCDYIYGIWEDSLPEGLMWKTWRPRLVSKKGCVTRIHSRAPSWSWASIDGPVIHPPTYRRQNLSQSSQSYRLKILSYNDVPRSFDPVRTAVDTSKAFQMKVRGLMRVVYYAGGIASRPSEFLLSGSSAPPQGGPSIDSQSAQRQSGPAQSRSAIGTWDTHNDFERETYHNQRIRALLILPHVGLLLSRTEGLCYRRIGHFWKAKEELFQESDWEDVTLV